MSWEQEKERNGLRSVKYFTKQDEVCCFLEAKLAKLQSSALRINNHVQFYKSRSSWFENNINSKP